MVRFAFALSLLVLTTAVHAAPVNHVANGDFELGPNGKGLVNRNLFGAMEGAEGNRSWDVWQTLPGWTTAAGAGIEVQTSRTLGTIDARSGSHYVELDSHPTSGGNSKMQQTVTLAAGKYQLSYWYAPRTATRDDNGLGVWFDGAQIAAHSETTKTQGGWAQFFANVEVATGGDYLLAFAGTGIQNSLGALLDDVRLTATPIPAALPLMAAGMAGLAVWRRRRHA